VLPIDNPYWHVATEPYGPEGEYGAMLTYALVLLPGLWLAWSLFSKGGAVQTRVKAARLEDARS
jgi:high-affinity iron transporter